MSRRPFTPMGMRRHAQATEGNTVLNEAPPDCKCEECGYSWVSLYEGKECPVCAEADNEREGQLQ